MSLEIKAVDKYAFKGIFELVAKNGKIDKAGLKTLFKMINYNISEEQFNEIVTKLFVLGKFLNNLFCLGKEQITCDDFMKIFNLKLNEYSAVDVRNAFKLIAKDDDKFIPMKKINKILEKNGLSDVEIQFLVRQLEPYTDSSGRINYQDFLKSLSL